MSRSRKLQTLAATTVVLVGALAVTGSSFAAAAHRAIAAKVSVTFTDRSFRVSSLSLQSGTTTFVVRNTGKKSHVFAVSGPGVKSVRTAPLASGKSATLTVTLRTGSYMLSDPVGLGPYAVQFVDVVHATSVTAVGGSSVVAPPVTAPPMCGGSYTP